MKAAFIATQAPMASTIEDFYRMVWESSVKIIVMLMKETEGEQVCANYLPCVRIMVNILVKNVYSLLTHPPAPQTPYFVPAFSLHCVTAMRVKYSEQVCVSCDNFASRIKLKQYYLGKFLFIQMCFSYKCHA